MLLGRNAELGGSEVWHRGAGRLVEGYLSTLLPCHNEARSVHDRATAQRTAAQLKSGGRRLLRKVISSVLMNVPGPYG